MAEPEATPVKKRAKRGEGPKIERHVYLQFRPVVTDEAGNTIDLAAQGYSIDFEVVNSSGDKRKALDMFMASQNDKTLIMKTLTL